MCKYILLGIISLFFSMSAFSWTLEELLQKAISVEDLVAEGVTISSLEESTDAKKLSELKRKYSKLLKELKVKEAALIKQKKRVGADKPKKNKGFFGNAANAENATAGDLEKYQEMLSQLDGLLETGQINDSTYKIVKQIIEDLSFFHQNNIQISQEFSVSPYSDTYGQRLHLHPEEKSAPFELQAALMLDSLWRSFNFALQNDLLADFFTDGLGRSSGCLAARVERGATWKRTTEGALSQKLKLSPRSRAMASPSTVEELARKIVQDDYEAIGDMLDEDMSAASRNRAARKLCTMHAGKKGCEGESLTVNHFVDALREIFQLKTPASSPARKGDKAQCGGKQEEPLAAGRRLDLYSDEPASADFDDAEIIEANHNSYADIEMAQLPDGTVRRVTIRQVANDGNCGFSAVGMNRDTFIHLVYEAVRRGNLSLELQTLIHRMIQDAGVADIDEWVHMFDNPGFWMNDTHLAVFAAINNVTIHVFVVDHEANEFIPVQTFNPGQAQVVHLANVNLNPVMMGHAGHHMANNHFDELILDDEESIALGMSNMDMDNTTAAEGGPGDAATLEVLFKSVPGGFDLFQRQ